MVGTRGWDHEAWQGAFYEDILPPDWRFCYFSNLIRSVLLPAEAWQGVGADTLAQWMEDSDPEFRFVLELPDDTVHRAAALAAQAEGLAPRVAGFLLPAAGAGQGGGALGRLADFAPLCVDAGPAPAAGLAAACRAAGVALAWYPHARTEPVAWGDLLVTLVAEAELRSLRGIITRLGAWMGGTRQAGLFFTDPPGAPRLAEEARIIAELLGV